MVGKGLALLRPLIGNPTEGLGVAPPAMTSLRLLGNEAILSTPPLNSTVGGPAVELQSSSPSATPTQAIAAINGTSHGTALSRWFNGSGWRQIIIISPYLWLIAFFFVPFLIIWFGLFAEARCLRRRPVSGCASRPATSALTSTGVWRR